MNTLTTWDRIGMRAPVNVGDIIEVMSETIEDDGMVFEIHESGIVGAYHDAVGLVTYYRFGSPDAAYEAIAAR